jgi:LemA protein
MAVTTIQDCRIFMAWLSILLLVLTLLYIYHVYNELVAGRNFIMTSYSTVDVMLKKRWDLIPRLVSTVKAGMKHESEILEKIVRLRSEAMVAGVKSARLTIEQDLTNAILLLCSKFEAYPELKVNQSVLHLQKTLVECEEQISAARRAFNAAVLSYNNHVQMFPSMLVARFFGFKFYGFFEIKEIERISPDDREDI